MGWYVERMGSVEAAAAEWRWLTLLLGVIVVAAASEMLRRKAIQKGNGGGGTLSLPKSPPLKLPYFGHLLHLLLFSRGLPHRWFHKLSRNHGYGPLSSSSSPFLFLWLGRVPVLVVSSSAAARLILRDHDLSFASRPSTSASRHLLYGPSDLAFSPHGPHSRKVKELMIKNIFNVSRIRDYPHIRSQELARLVSSIAESADSVTPQPVRKMVNETALDILCRMVLGKPVRHFGVAFMELTRETLELLGAFNVGDLLPAVRWLDLQGYERRIKQARIKYDEILQRIIDDRRRESEESEGKDTIINTVNSTLFLDVLLLQDLDGGSSSNDDCIKAILVDLFLGGGDTISSTVEWGLCELLRNKDIMTKLREELDNVLGKGQTFQESYIPKLSFLQAVVKETLRLHPAAPLLNAHESTSPCVVDGYYVPAKTKTFVNAWAIARDESVWENPLDFLPQRFLNSTMDVKGQHYELLPFGAGRRICPAMNLGILLIQLLLATLVHCFEWSLPHDMEEIDMNEKFGLVLHKAIPLMATATPRLLKESYEFVS